MIEILPNFEGLFFAESTKKYLYKKYKIITKNVGIDISTKTMKDFVIEPFLIDKYSLAFILEKEPSLINFNKIEVCFNSWKEILQKSLEF